MTGDGRYNARMERGRMEQLRQRIREAGESGRFSGVVLVQHGDEVLLAEATGQAERRWGVSNSVRTRFRIASASKPFTAVAVLQQVAHGALALDTPVAGFLAIDAPGLPADVTTRHLLTMTAGIPDWFEEGEGWQERWAALRRTQPLYLLCEAEDYLPLFLSRQPHFPAGSQYRYNNASYILLGMMIARASGRPVFETIRRDVLESVGMAETAFLPVESASPNVATGYRAVRDETGNVTDWESNLYQLTPPGADGGATSTAADLIRFLQALREDRLLPPTLTAEMTRPQATEEGVNYRGYGWHYGYGLQILTGNGGELVRYGHTGEEEGVSCRIYHYPKANIDVAILGNQSWCAGPLGWEIHNATMEMTA